MNELLVSQYRRSSTQLLTWYLTVTNNH